MVWTLYIYAYGGEWVKVRPSENFEHANDLRYVHDPELGTPTLYILVKMAETPYFIFVCLLFNLPSATSLHLIKW